MNILQVNLLLIVIVSVLYFISAVPHRSRYKIASPKRTPRKNIYLYVCFILLVFVRTYVDIYSVPDLDIYESSYRSMKTFNLSELFMQNEVKTDEPGFRFLMWISYNISPNFAFFLFVTACICIYSYFKTAKSYSSFIVVSVILILVTFFNQSIYILRQYIAIALIYLAYPWIIKRNLKNFLLFETVAVLFHITAAIFFPVYIIYGIKDNKLFITTLAAFGIILSISLSWFFSFFGDNVLVGYSSYLDSDTVSNNIGAIIMTAYVIAYFIFLRKKVFEEGINRLILVILIFGLIFSYVGIGFNPTSRMALYFTTIPFLAVPKIMEYIKNRNVAYLFSIAVILLNYYISFKGTKFIVLEQIKLAL